MQVRLRLGSLNPVKKEALLQAFHECRRFSDIAIETLAVDSGVSDQPMGFESILSGARNRAKGAWERRLFLGVGIESGMIPVPLTRNGYMNLTACVFYNGRNFFTGLGPAFELPESVLEGILEKNMELDEAVQAAGLSENPRIGYREGLIGLLTNQVITRMEYTKPAVHMALASLAVGE